MQRALAAAGFILAHRGSRGLRYLLLHSARNAEWGFPKGHAEPGESEVETARRETLEETGIAEIDVIPDFKFRCEYMPRNAKRGVYLKQVTYFLGLVHGTSLRLSEEHDRGEWLSLEDASRKLNFDNVRLALAQAHDRLKPRP